MKKNIKRGDVVTHPASHLDENYRWIGTVIEEVGQDIIIQYRNGKTQRIGKQLVRKND